MRYLAIDYGTARTGLAICDAGETIASPHSTIQGRNNQLLDKIAAVIEAERVEAVVLGLPLNMDGSQSAQTRLTLKFGEKLRGLVDIPVHLQDERLSSFSAELKLASANLTRGKMKRRVDAVAAAEILQMFLERQASTDSPVVDGP